MHTTACEHFACHEAERQLEEHHPELPLPDGLVRREVDGKIVLGPGWVRSQHLDYDAYTGKGKWAKQTRKRVYMVRSGYTEREQRRDAARAHLRWLRGGEALEPECDFSGPANCEKVEKAAGKLLERAYSGLNRLAGVTLPREEQDKYEAEMERITKRVQANLGRAIIPMHPRDYENLVRELSRPNTDSLYAETYNAAADNQHEIDLESRLGSMLDSLANLLTDVVDVRQGKLSVKEQADVADVPFESCTLAEYRKLSAMLTRLLERETRRL